MAGGKDWWLIPGEIKRREETVRRAVGLIEGWGVTAGRCTWGEVARRVGWPGTEDQLRAAARQRAEMDGVAWPLRGFRKNRGV